MLDSDSPFRRNSLYRDPEAGWVAGVCIGLAERFAVSAGIIRLAFVLLAFGGTPVLAIVAYGILAFLMPVRPLPVDSWQRARFRRDYRV